MIIDILLPVSLLFIMFSLGLELSINNFKNVINNPLAFSLGIMNQMFVLPLVTFTIIIIFGLSTEIAVGLMILSCCPGGVTSNIITKISKGDTALSISLTAIVSIVSVFSLPMIVGFSMNYFMGKSAPDINILNLAVTMFLITTLPVLLGLYINERYNKFSISFAPLTNKISSFLFVIIVIGALASEWNTFINNIHSLGPAIVTLISFMVFIGYYSPKLFGINQSQSITISIESSIQNATVGITIGNIILNYDKGISVLSLPSGVYGIMMYLICLPVMFFILKSQSNRIN
jgi:BASS family bile acid:Na+ symporter